MKKSENKSASEIRLIDYDADEVKKGWNSSVVIHFVVINPWAYGKSGTRNPEAKPETEPEPNEQNEWYIQVWKYDWHQNSSSILWILRKMDDDTRKKRVVRMEWITQSW